MTLKPVEGAIQGVDTAKSTSLGTSTTKTTISGANMIVPAWAREIVAFVPYYTDVAHANNASDQIQAKMIVESEDCVIQPFQVVLTGMVGGLGTIHDQHQVTPEIFECHCPVKGGEEITISGQSLAAVTDSGPEMGVSIIYSSVRSGQRQIFSKVGTCTSTPTTSGEGPGTAFNIYGAEEIISVKGSICLSGASLGTSEPLFGYFRLTSPDFSEPTPLEFCATPHPAGLGTIGTPTHGEDVRFDVRIPVTKTCTVQDYFNLENDITDAGKFTTTVFFHKTGR